MKKKFIAAGVFALVALSAMIFIFYSEESQPIEQKEGSQLNSTQTVRPVQVDKTFKFLCADNKSIIATFHLPQDENVDLILSDGRKLSVPHAISASGARYANQNESFVFWNKGNTAFIMEKNATTYKDCVTND